MSQAARNYTVGAPIGRALRIAAENYEKALQRTYGERYLTRMLRSESERLRRLNSAVSERQAFVARSYAMAEMLSE